jgi:hypothetical protein
MLVLPLLFLLNLPGNLLTTYSNYRTPKLVWPPPVTPFRLALAAT